MTACLAPGRPGRRQHYRLSTGRPFLTTSGKFPQARDNVELCLLPRPALLSTEARLRAKADAGQGLREGLPPQIPNTRIVPLTRIARAIRPLPAGARLLERLFEIRFGKSF